MPSRRKLLTKEALEAVLTQWCQRYMAETGEQLVDVALYEWHTPARAYCRVTVATPPIGHNTKDKQAGLRLAQEAPS